MGGCKCTFRACPVSSQKFPKMTFFRYPLAKGDRNNKWIEYADYAQIHEMASSQAKNRTVCGLHFRNECFMNYKKNRLTPTAIPTLDRLNNGQVIDYSLGPDPKPISLPPIKDQHLLAPDGVLIWGQPQEFWNTYSTLTNFKIMSPLAKKPRILHNSLISMAPEVNKNFEFEESSTINLDEGLYTQDPDTVNDDEVIDIVDDECNINLTESTTCHVASNPSTDEVFHSDDVEFLTEEESVEEHVSKNTFEITCNAYEAEIQRLKKELETREKNAEQRITDLRADVVSAKENLQQTESLLATCELKNKEFEKKIVDLEDKNKALLKAAQLAEPTPLIPKHPAISTALSTPLTKPQLFNGIKKYLSASMTALVRMEMFGNSERPWKLDEKQVCVELLKLGENIYKYLRDEWRFRLPPKTLVEQWTTEVTEEQEDDL